jgi:3-deoxy-7-phosphoheptulonate synthase
MVDCSHGNSYKDHKQQINVAQSLADQMADGDTSVFGVMIESFLVEGNQKVEAIDDLTYGQSITDACVDLAESENMLDILANAVKANRA